MKPLQWLVVATGVPPGGSLGGVVRYTTELMRALAVRDDVVLSALATRAAADTVSELIGSAGRVYPVPGTSVPVLSVRERYGRLPGPAGSFDVVQGVKHLVPRRAGPFRVLTVHDLLLLDRPADFGLAKRRLLPGAYRRSLVDADLLLCVSEATRQRVRAHLPRAAPRAEVVRLATSSTLLAAVPQPLPALLGRPFALVVGDSSQRKNLATVVAAWEQVRAAHPEAVLAMAGPPEWGRTDVGPTFDRLVAEGALVHLGQVSDAELRWAYEQAQVVLCPSLAEGFGLPAAEALDFGAPVLISTDPALREVCAGRELASLAAQDVAAWAQACLAVFASPAPRAIVAVTRSWDDVAAETVAAVQRSLASRTRP